MGGRRIGGGGGSTGGSPTIVSGGDAGPPLSLGRGVAAIVRLPGHRTGGRFAIVEQAFDPGGLVGPHTHANEDECSFVLRGEVTVRVGDEVVAADQGTTVYRPRGTEHALWNESDTPARVLQVIAPGGFSRFFEEAVALLSEDGSWAEEAFRRLGARYGIAFSFEGADDLVRRYGLRPR